MGRPAKKPGAAASRWSKFLSDAEKDFLDRYLMTGNKRGSYTEAFKDDPTLATISGSAIDSRADTVLNSPVSKKYMEFCTSSNEEMAMEHLRNAVMNGGADASAAAKILAEFEGKAQAKDAVDRFFEIITEVGGEVEVQPCAEPYRLPLGDIFKGGRFKIHLPLAAKLALLQRAKFPWARDPNAKISDKQIEVLSAEDRFKIIHAGTGYGKSTLGAAEALLELCIPGSKIAIIGENYDHAAKEWAYLVEGFKQLFGRDMAATFKNAFDRKNVNMEIRTRWDSSVKVFSMTRDQGGQMQGETFDLVILAEGAFIDPDVWKRRILRALDRSEVEKADGTTSRPTGRATIFTTPKFHEGTSAYLWEMVMELTKNHPEKQRYPNVPWDESYLLIEGESLDNPGFSRKKYAAAKKSMNPEEFAETYRGKMTRRTGLVIPEFNEEFHREPLPKPEAIKKMRLCVGIDTGKHFAAVLLGLDKDKKAHALGEVYEVARSSKDNYEAIDDMLLGILGPAYVTSNVAELRSYVDIWAVDPRSQDKANAEAYLEVPLYDSALEKDAGLNIVRDAFINEKLVLSEDITRLSWELGRYSWRKETKGTLQAGQVNKVDDHMVDALRYGLTLLLDYGPVEEEQQKHATFGDAYEADLKDKLFGPARGMLYRPEGMQHEDVFRA